MIKLYLSNDVIFESLEKAFKYSNNVAQLCPILDKETIKNYYEHIICNNRSTL